MASVKPGWSSEIKDKASQRPCKLLFDTQGNVRIVHWLDNNQYFDSKKNRLNKSLVDTVEAGIRQATPRTTLGTPLQDPKSSSAYSTAKLKDVEIKSKTPAKLRDDDALFTEDASPPDKPPTQKFPSILELREGLSPAGKGISDVAFDEVKTVTSQPPQGGVVKDSWFFEKGRVFRIWWAEPKGVSSTQQDDKAVFSTLRPFVVVKPYTAHCICLPVYSYGGRGVAKTGLKFTEIEHHAILYKEGTTPQLVTGEQQHKDTMRKPFAVKTDEGLTLARASRIRFDMSYTIRYNLKVINIGKISKEHLDRLTECWDIASGAEA